MTSHLAQKDVDPRCLEIIGTHSGLVFDKAVTLARASIFRDRIDYVFLREAAMLHDYGIIYVDAPGIFCFGHEPYLRHGLCGAEHLRRVDPVRYARHARVCEVHIGTGLTAAEIRNQSLPLPARDFLPLTPEERLITYADNFFSKNPAHLAEQKPFERIASATAEHGQGALDRLMALRAEWGE